MGRSKKILIYAASNLVAVFILALPFGLLSGNAEFGLAHILSNAFFICGVLEGGVGILSWVSNQGGFDMFSYASKVVLYKFKPKEKLPSYYDHVQERKEERKAWLKGCAICGGICILIALALLLLS